MAICNPFRDTDRYANRAIPRAAQREWRTNGRCWQIERVFSLSFSDERDANGTWEIDADANAEIRTKKANETAGVKAGLSVKYHHLELELGATGMAVKKISFFFCPVAVTARRLVRHSFAC